MNKETRKLIKDVLEVAVLQGDIAFLVADVNESLASNNFSKLELDSVELNKKVKKLNAINNRNNPHSLLFEKLVQDVQKRNVSALTVNDVYNMNKSVMDDFEYNM